MIAKAKTHKSDHFDWDDKLPGFGLRTRGKRRTYVIQYKTKDGSHQRRMTLGSAKVLTRDQARRLAKVELGKVAGGEDPQGARQAARTAPSTDTFKAIADQFLAYQESQLRPSTLSAVKRYLTVYFKPLHALKIDAVPRREIATILKTISNNHGPVAADRACSAITSLFAWAMRDGLVDKTPVENMNKFAGITSRDRVLNDKELAAIMLAQGADDYGRILKLLILTGQRRDEIAGLRRSEIGDGVLEIPGERTKNHRPHIVPLSDSARAIIKDQLDDNERDLIFGRGKGGFSGFSKAKRELDAKLPSLKPWTVHDIRRSVATGMAELGVEPHIVEAVLNHVSGYRSGVAGVYNKAAYLGPKTEALKLWANHIAVIVAQSSGANVERLTDRSRGLARTGKFF